MAEDSGVKAAGNRCNFVINGSKIYTTDSKDHTSVNRQTEPSPRSQNSNARPETTENDLVNTGEYGNAVDTLKPAETFVNSEGGLRSSDTIKKLNDSAEGGLISVHGSN